MSITQAGRIQLEIVAVAEDRVTAVLKNVGGALDRTRKDLEGASKHARGSESAMSRMAEAVKGAAEQLKSFSGGAGGAFESLAGIAGSALKVVGPVGAVAAGVAALAAAAYQVGKPGAQLLAVFQRLGPTAEEAEARLRKLQNATGGVFSVESLARFEGAQREMGISLGLTGEELGKVAAKFAVLGIEGGDALQKLAQGIGEGEQEMAQVLGLSLDMGEVVRRYAESTGRAESALTAQDKVHARVLAVKAALAETGSVGESYFTSFQRAGASLADAWSSVQTFLAPLGPFLADLAGIVEDILGTAGDLRPVMEGVGAALHIVGKTTAEVFRLVRIVVVGAEAAIYRLAEAATSVVPGLGELEAHYAARARALGQDVAALMGATDAAEEHTASLREQKAAIDAANKAFDERLKLLTDTESAELQALDAEEQLIRVRMEAQDLTRDEADLMRAGLEERRREVQLREQVGKATQELARRQDELRAAVASGIITQGEADAQLGALQGRLSSLTTSLGLLGQAIAFVRGQRLEEALGAKTPAPRARGGGGGARGPDPRKAIEDARLALALARETDDVRRLEIQQEAELARLARERAPAEVQTLTRMRLEIEMRRAVAKATAAQVKEALDLAEAQRVASLRNLSAAERAFMGRNAQPSNDERALDLDKRQQSNTSETSEERLARMRREGEAAADAIRGATGAMSESLGVLGQFQPALAALAQAVASTGQAWADYAAGQVGVAAAIGKSLGAMGPAVAGFVSGIKEKAAVMALFEAAQAVATTFVNPLESASHWLAASMFGGFATGAIAAPSSASAAPATASTQAAPQRTPVAGTITGTTINVYGALGQPQDLARLIARAVHDARGTGRAAAAA